jgi:hypothetical protein
MKRLKHVVLQVFFGHVDYATSEAPFEAFGVEMIPTLVWLSKDLKAVDTTFLVPEHQRLDSNTDGRPGTAWDANDFANFLKNVSKFDVGQVLFLTFSNSSLF